MAAINPFPLVQTHWLADHLDDRDIRIVDCSWYLPPMGRDGRAEYAAAHIPGAVFWDIDAIADRTSDLPHMMPAPDDFARHMEALGIGSGTAVVLYDGMGLFTAARPWWMLRAMGHDAVGILDGGLPKWTAEGRPVDDAPAAPREVRFQPDPEPGFFHDLDDVREIVRSQDKQVLDARSAGRYAGAEPEPRPNCRAGHMPGALNLPYDRLLDPASRTVLPGFVLRRRFEEAGADLARPVVTSCGSGVTACVLALGLHLIGKHDVAVYDGSWSEWGTRDDTPVETG